MSQQPTVITITDYVEAREVYRQRDLRQALYDDGEVIMADVLVNLHGAQHRYRRPLENPLSQCRERRRLETRVFRRGAYEPYEVALFPPIIAETLDPEVRAGRSELVDLG